jgi:hypothetical protein
MTDQISQLYNTRRLKKYIKINRILCREAIYHMAYSDRHKRRKVLLQASCYRISAVYKQMPKKQPELPSYRI